MNSFTVSPKPNKYAESGFDSKEAAPNKVAISLNDRTDAHKRLFENEAERFLTIKEYLGSFISDELNVYRDALSKYTPTYYIDPRIETPRSIVRKIPNPIQTFLTDPDTSKSASDGLLGVVLAEPGQGKTYMCEHLVTRLLTNKGSFPIYVSATQWETMKLEDLSSLGKTLTHSFHYAESPISWLIGCEDSRSLANYSYSTTICNGINYYF